MNRCWPYLAHVQDTPTICRCIYPNLCKTYMTTAGLCQKAAKKGWTVSTLQQKHAVDINRIRNIGIMAHIDAGKTTTTERMLFYSGFTRHLGDVDDGDTVMDYMEQERARGITITSAAITFLWNKHKLNLIDTPGHVDFTVEVERSLRVLDGAVAILDASAGVEAQTITVWKQADNYRIPRLVFINKMDKLGADFSASVNSLEEKLHAIPLRLQLPMGQESSFRGLVDLIHMEKLIWNSPESEGRIFLREPLSVDDSLYEESHHERTKLIETLADVDDAVADFVLSDADFDKIPSDILQHAVRKATLQHSHVPILCGSSLRNKGVQPLLDAIVSYLPSPSDVRYDFVPYYKDNLCALAFKIIHDKQRGVLTFARIYSGKMQANSVIHNANRSCSEKITRIMEVYADEYRDISEAVMGNIVALSGLKETITGDTLVSSAKAVADARKAYRLSAGKQSANSVEVITESADDPEIEDDHVVGEDPVLAGLNVPDPVFLCSIEPASMSHQKGLEHALACLTREDPSLHVTINEETGQTILSGMGELHLEVILDRIRKEYKVDAELGEVFIAYREAITARGEETHTLDRQLGDTRHLVMVSVSVKPADDDDKERAKTDVKFKHTVEPYPNSILKEKPIRIQHRRAVKNGIISAFNRGPILHFPVIEAHVSLHDLVVGRGTSTAMITAAVSQAVRSAMEKAKPVLLEPLMALEIQTDETYLGSVLKDLSQRRSQIGEVKAKGESRTVMALTPLSELMGYATTLRTFTSGTASFSMELHSYQSMSEQHQQTVIARTRGFL